MKRQPETTQGITAATHPRVQSALHVALHSADCPAPGSGSLGDDAGGCPQDLLPRDDHLVGAALPLRLLPPRHCLGGQGVDWRAHGRPWRAGVHALQVLYSSRHPVMCGSCRVCACNPSGHACDVGLLQGVCMQPWWSGQPFKGLTPSCTSARNGSVTQPFHLPDAR